MSAVIPLQLLEINLISVQDIAKVSKSMRTYAVAWVHPDRKLKTRVDTDGGINPTWNDKFIFRVDDQFLKSDTSAIMVDIYALHWLKDTHVGTVRVLVSNIIPPQTRAYNQNHIGMRFVALQVRRKSGRPQGILNIGVTVLDSTKRSMPLYTQGASAVGYQTLMGQSDFHSHKANKTNTNRSSDIVQLRRSKSDRSSMLGMQECVIDFESNNDFSKPTNSVINGSEVSYVVSKKNKVVYDKPLSIVDGVDAMSSISLAMKLRAQEAKAKSILSSVASSTQRAGGGARNSSTRRKSKVNRSEIGVVPSLLRDNFDGKTTKKAASVIEGMRENSNEKTVITKPKHNFDGKTTKKAASVIEGMRENSNEKPVITKPKHNWLPPIDNKKQSSNDNNKNNHRKYPISKDFAAGSIWSESEVGPSPSEVAAAIAEDNRYRHYDDGGSSMLDNKWSVDESEGVRTKLERWRTEMPHQYDYSRSTDGSSSLFSTKRHARRHTEGGGKFSCFSNICGLECSIVCGKGGNNNPYKMKKDSNSKQVGRAYSMDSVSTYL